MIKTDKYFFAIGSILASIYLTFIVDVYTLNTFPKRVFVFLYFLVICCAAICLKKKLLKGETLPVQTRVAAVVLAAAILGVGHSCFFPKAQETTISLAAVPCEDDSYREVWLTSLQVDGREIQLSKLKLDANQGWIYSGDYDDYVYYPGENTDNTNYLTFQVNGEEIVLTFAENAWSGSVNVMENAAKSVVLPLTAAEGGGDGVSYAAEGCRRYAVWEYILYGLGLWIVLNYLIELVWALFLGGYKGEKYRADNVGRCIKAAEAIYAFVLSLALTLCGYFENWPWKASCAFVLGNFLIILYAIRLLKKEYGGTATGWKNAASSTAAKVRGGIFLLIVLIQAFLFSFNQFMISPFEVYGGIPKAIAMYCLFVTYAGAWGIAEIGLLRKLADLRAENAVGEPDRRSRVFLFILIWLILATAWMLWWKAYFPAHMSPDSVDQWQQAVGVNSWHDAHPLFSTLWVTFCSRLWRSPGSVILMQILIGAAIYAGVLVSCIARGLSKRTVLVLGIGIALLPNIGMYMVTQWKDVPFLLALLSLAYLTQQAVWQDKLGWMRAVMLAAAMFGVSVWRHNGFLIAAGCGLLLLIHAIVKRKIQVGAALLVSLLCVQLFNGPVYQKLGIDHYGIGLAGIVTDCVGYTIYYNGDIPEDILEEATEEMPEEFWREQFAPYHAFNYVYNGTYNLSSIYADKSTSEQLSILFRLFIRNPRIIFYERMAMNDTNLFVYQARAEGSLNSRFAYGISQNDVGLVQQRNRLTDQLDRVLNAMAYEDPLLDSIFWRNGLMICAALWLLYYCFVDKRLKNSVFLVPMILNFMTLFIALAEQSYRFTHNVIPYLVFGVLCATMPERGRGKGVKTRGSSESGLKGIGKERLQKLFDKNKIASGDSKRIMAESLVLLFSIFFLYAFIHNNKTFYYDAIGYWETAQGVVSRWHIDFSAYPQDIRGYFLPVIMQIFQLFGDLKYVLLWVWQSVLLTVTLAVCFPYLFKIPHTRRTQIGLVGAAFCILYFWPDILLYPLSDLPGLCLAVLSVVCLSRSGEIKSLPKQIFLSAGAGAAAYAAYNTRPVFLYALVPALIVFVWKNRRRRSCYLAVAFFATGCLLLALPQMYINHHWLGTYSPGVFTEQYTNGVRSLQMQQVLWGTYVSKYETYVGSTIHYRTPGVQFVDQIANCLLYREGITTENFTLTAVLQLLIKYPLDVCGIYARHLVGLLTPAYGQLYITDIAANKTIRICAAIAVWFFGVFGLYARWGEKTEGRQYLLIGCLNIPAIMMIFGAPETRFFLSVYFLWYFYVFCCIDWKQTLVWIRTHWLKLMIPSVVIVFAWVTIMGNVMYTGLEKPLFMSAAPTKYSENVIYETDSITIEDTASSDVIRKLSEISDCPSTILRGNQIYQISFEIDGQVQPDRLVFDIRGTDFNNWDQGFVFSLEPGKTTYSAACYVAVFPTDAEIRAIYSTDSVCVLKNFKLSEVNVERV